MWLRYRLRYVRVLVVCYTSRDSTSMVLIVAIQKLRRAPSRAPRTCASRSLSSRRACAMSATQRAVCKRLTDQWANDGPPPRVFLHGDSILRGVCFALGLCVRDVDGNQVDRALNGSHSCRHWQYLTRYESSCCRPRSRSPGNQTVPAPPALDCATVVHVHPTPYKDIKCTSQWLYNDLWPPPSASDLLVLQHGAHVHVDERSLEAFAVFARATVGFAAAFPGTSPIPWIEPLPQHFPTGAWTAIKSKTPWEARVDSTQQACTPLSVATHRPQFRRVEIVRHSLSRLKQPSRIRLVQAYSLLAAHYNHHERPMIPNHNRSNVTLDCTHWDGFAYRLLDREIARALSVSWGEIRQAEHAHVGSAMRFTLERRRSR